MYPLNSRGMSNRVHDAAEEDQTDGPRDGDGGDDEPLGAVEHPVAGKGVEAGGDEESHDAKGELEMQEEEHAQGCNRRQSGDAPADGRDHDRGAEDEGAACEVERSGADLWKLPLQSLVADRCGQSVGGDGDGEGESGDCQVESRSADLLRLRLQ